jgi:hypothetical protein
MSPTPALIEAPPRLRTAPALARAVVRDLCHQDGISAREQPALTAAEREKLARAASRAR